MADSGGALDAFRAEARAWLEENYPASLRGDSRSGERAMMGGFKFEGDHGVWKKRMADKGWGTPTWPKKYGAGGLSPAEARVLQQEMDRIGAYNPMVGMGLSMFGPTLLEYGTEEQKQRHIPPIVRGELRWCQGYSEPGAGSDLASLTTKCEDAGDHWKINGQKIWTSRAQLSSYAILLARTGGGPRHKGITYFLLGMAAPGVRIRPLEHMLGEAEFNEVFLDDVFIPDADVVGEVDDGWRVAMGTLAFERVAIATGRVNTTGAVNDLIAEIAARTGDDGRPLGTDPLIRQHIADLYGRALTHYSISQRGTNRRRGIGFARVNLKGDDCFDFLCHEFLCL